MLASPDTSTSIPVDMIPPVDLDSSSSSSDLRSLLLSIPPEILPKAIRFLTTWRLQEPRSALPTASVLAEELDYAHPGRRIRWISKEYYEELEIDQRRGGSRTEDDDEANDEKNTFLSQHAHGLDASQLRRGCHIPRACPSNSTPTIKPVPTKTIPTRAISTTHKAIPTTRKTISTSLISTKKPKSRPIVAKPKPKPVVDSENIPPSQVPRRRPAARKSRIPALAPQVFGLHNA
ncbi:hypothetical protein F5146DRAFT_1141006 [Armillaria mellea]|nr:hypothetical protein F5146DRAFT_1141006 [Armillaria mellea]